MSDFTPVVAIALQIRKIIFERFNNVDTVFTNDEIFEIIKKNGDVDPAWIVDDVEPFFNEICKSGLARNIAQNFTTIHLKLFDPLKKICCDTCSQDIYLGASEESRICPDPSCKSVI